LQRFLLATDTLTKPARVPLPAQPTSFKAYGSVHLARRNDSAIAASYGVELVDFQDLM
jgi:hypothetical protein